MPREFEIRKEIEIDATPEQIWQAIATGPGITAWFMPHEVEPGEGGTVRLTVEGHEEDSVITAWEPGKHLAYRGNLAEDGTVHAMEYLIEGRDGASTVLRFVHSGVLGDGWDGEYEASMTGGWDMYLHTLGQYVTYFLGRPVTFVNANGPDASADEKGWAALQVGLGIDGSPEPGDTVRLSPNGLPPIDGVVDYLGPSFLGVRSSEGLYRFHGLADLGLPVAIGHHLYVDGLDREALERDWSGWLTALYL